MKRIIAAVSVTLLFSQLSFAIGNTLPENLMAPTASNSNTITNSTPTKIGIVNINQAFNESRYVQDANKKLQTNVQNMEKNVQEEQQKIQKLVKQYDEMKKPGAAKTKLQNQILDEQKKLNQMTQTFQNNIRDEQAKGMQEFTKKVQDATTIIAKEKQLNAVFSSAAIIYADGSWIDITQDIVVKL